MQKKYSKEVWKSVIDGTKTVHEIAKEMGVSRQTVYLNARRLNLPLLRPLRSEKDYNGISVAMLKDELKALPAWAVAKKHGLEPSAFVSFLRRRGIDFFKVRHSYKTIEPEEPTRIRRTGMAMDMIITLLPFYNDAAIARVFGYSKERIRQIRNKQEGK